MQILPFTSCYVGIPYYKNMVHLGTLNHVFLSSAFCGMQITWWFLLLGTPCACGSALCPLTYKDNGWNVRHEQTGPPPHLSSSSWNELPTWQSHPMEKGGDMSEQDCSRLGIDPSKRKDFSLHLICTLITKTSHTWIKSIVSCCIFIDVKQFSTHHVMYSLNHWMQLWARWLYLF